jgi:hypothetical protein
VGCVTETVLLPRPHRVGVAAAAAVSVVTMPLTAMWFLLVGGVLLVAGLARAAVTARPCLGLAGSVGLGLLVGPAIYVALALVQ